MKISNILLGLALVVSLFVCVALSVTASGNARMLDAIQAIRFGMTQTEVMEIMDCPPQVAPADKAPKWIKDVTGETETGEFWHYFMGFPPRNLIIYFDQDGRVVNTTWAST